MGRESEKRKWVESWESGERVRRGWGKIGKGWGEGWRGVIADKQPVSCIDILASNNSLEGNVHLQWDYVTD